MDGNQLVLFESPKKNYNHGENISISVFCTNYVPLKQDWIGIFACDIEGCDTPFCYEWISPVIKEEEHKKVVVTIKTDFVVGHVTLFELRYVNEKRSVIAKSSPFTITMGNPGSFITVKDGVASDDSLVFVDKVSRNKEQETKKEVELVDKSESRKDNFNIIDALEIFDKSEEGESDSSEDERKQELLQREDGLVPSSYLVREIERRRRAEKAVREYGRSLSSQMLQIEENTESIIEFKNTCRREKAIKEELVSDYESAREMVDAYSSELIGIKNVATNFKHECSRLRKKNSQQETMLDRLKSEIMDKKEDDFRQKFEELRIVASKEISSHLDEIESLEESIKAERDQVICLRVELKSLKENHNVIADKLRESVDAKSEEIEKLKTALKSAEEKYDAKSKDNVEQYEEIINRLEKELKIGMENKEKVSSDFQKTIEELESRVVNESNKASRAENDLAVAENRFKESTEDIKFFRQKVLETEQKLQVSQSQLAKANEEIFNLRALLSSDTTDTESLSRISVYSDTVSEDKSTVCGSTSASASTSVENFSDRERRIDDMTDDESWCGASSVRSQSLESLPNSQSGSNNAVKGKVSTTAGLIIVKSISDTATPQQQDGQSKPIAIVEARRPVAKKGRRKYGKPIDLTPSTSVTSTVSTSTVDRASLAIDRKDNVAFSRNVSELDRLTLERQYVAIRQHRNSLVRENSYLKSKVNALKSDLMFAEKSLQNLSLEAEHKVGMLLIAINNHEYISPQELDSLLQMFPFPSSQYLMSPDLIQNQQVPPAALQQQQQQQQQQQHLQQLQQFQQLQLQQQQQQQQQQQLQQLQQQQITQQQQQHQKQQHQLSDKEDDKNHNGGFLSPYAAEYTPTNQSHQSQLTADHQSLYIPYMTNEEDNQQHHQTDSSYIFSTPTQHQSSVPAQLPPTPTGTIFDNNLVDASDQLAAIGVSISKTF